MSVVLEQNTNLNHTAYAVPTQANSSPCRSLMMYGRALPTMLCSEMSDDTFESFLSEFTHEFECAEEK